MDRGQTADPARQTRGIALMTVAMLSIPMVDGFAKALSAEYSPLFISWARYVVACLIVVPLAAFRHRGGLFPQTRRSAHLLRTLCLMASMTLYFLAIARIPLATAISAFFVGPIVAVVLSVLVLKERMTVWKLLSLALGFGGALVILRPGAAVEPGLLMAFGSGLCFALYMIATRAAAQGSSPLQTLVFQCVVGALLLTPQAIWTWSLPAAEDLLFFAALGAFSAFSHVLSIAAFRLADASTLAPLVYLELIASAAIGFIAFGEVPGWSTLVGAALIVTGGLVLLRRR